MKKMMFFLVLSLFTPIFAQANGDFHAEFCAQLNRVIDAGEKDRFESLKGELDDTFEGDRIWNSPVFFIGKPKKGSQCEIWNYADGSSPVMFCDLIPRTSIIDRLDERIEALRSVLVSCLSETRGAPWEESDGNRNGPGRIERGYFFTSPSHPVMIKISSVRFENDSKMNMNFFLY